MPVARHSSVVPLLAYFQTSNGIWTDGAGVAHPLHLVTCHGAAVDAAHVAHGLRMVCQVGSRALQNGRLAAPSQARHQDPPWWWHVRLLPERLHIPDNHPSRLSGDHQQSTRIVDVLPLPARADAEVLRVITALTQGCLQWLETLEDTPGYWSCKGMAKENWFKQRPPRALHSHAQSSTCSSQMLMKRLR